MRRESGDEDQPPNTRGCKQKRSQQNRVRGPEDRNRVRLEGQRKSDPCAEVVASKNEQANRDRLTAKNGGPIRPLERRRCEFRGSHQGRRAFHELFTLAKRLAPSKDSRR